MTTIQIYRSRNYDSSKGVGITQLAWHFACLYNHFNKQI